MPRLIATIWLLALVIGTISCSGGGGGSSTPPAASTSAITVLVSPATAKVLMGGTQPFTATVSGSSNKAVNWSVQEGAAGGSITSAGLYTAPPVPGTYHVVASSQADATKSAAAIITVPPFSVAISPSTTTVDEGGAQIFTATVIGSVNTAVNWSVQEGAVGGTITNAGLYTAPLVPGICHVVATSQADSTKDATATVTVPPVSVTIDPQTDTLGPDGTRTFTARVFGTVNTAVTWTVQEGAAGGTIDSGGHYTAPTTLGTFHVIATSLADASQSAVAAITVVQSGFTATGSMGTARAGHTATLLPNGRVLVAGGSSAGGSPTASAELFDPGSGTFTSTGSMAMARWAHTATLLSNGKVLMAGGDDSSGRATAKAELFDPANDSFTLTGSMGTARGFHKATLLPDGKVLIAGGVDPSIGQPLASAEVFDPATGSFTPAGSMVQGRAVHTATVLPNGKVLVAGGLLFFYAPIATAELFDPASGTFTSAGTMGSVRWAHTATLLANGKVMVSGGDDDVFNSLVSAELFDPASGAFTATGSLGTARNQHTATLLQNGKVLVAGGNSDSSCFDCDFVDTVILAAAELFDPASGTFTATGSLGTARNGHTATLLQNGKVLVTGGTDSSGAVLASAELYQ